MRLPKRDGEEILKRRRSSPATGASIDYASPRRSRSRVSI